MHAWYGWVVDEMVVQDEVSDVNNRLPSGHSVETLLDFRVHSFIWLGLDSLVEGLVVSMDRGY